MINKKNVDSISQQSKFTNVNGQKKVKDTKITDHLPRVTPQKKVKPAKKSADSTTPSTFPVTPVASRLPVTQSEATPLTPLDNAGLLC